MGGAKLAGPFRKEPLTLFHWLETTDWPWRRSPAAHFRSYQKASQGCNFLCSYSNISLPLFPSLIVTEIHSPPLEKKKCTLAASKNALYLLQFRSQITRNLLPWYPLGKLGGKDSSSRPRKLITPGPSRAILLRGLLDPKSKGSSKRCTSQWQEKCYWAEGRCDGGCSLGKAL